MIINEKEMEKHIQRINEIISQHGANRDLVGMFMVVFKTMGFGRNKENAAALRALAALMDSDLPRFSPENN